MPPLEKGDSSWLWVFKQRSDPIWPVLSAERILSKGTDVGQSQAGTGRGYFSRRFAISLWKSPAVLIHKARSMSGLPGVQG